MLSESELDKLLDKWYETKQEILQLEKKAEKYKKCCEKIMNKEGNDTISTKDYKLTRNMITRTALSRQSVPNEIWLKYSTKCTYPVYTLKQSRKKD